VTVEYAVTYGRNELHANLWCVFFTNNE